MLKDLFDTDTVEIREEFICVFLNNSNNTLGWTRLTTGGITGCIVDVRLLFVTALKCGATSLIISHNHPSGSLKPSNADINLTHKVKKAGEVLDINLLDHIIYTTDGYYSMNDNQTL